MKQRFAYIDFLRAFSIIGVIAVHVLSFSLSSTINLFIWNSLQCVVAIFIFCSGFVHGHYTDKLASIQSVVSWYKKRSIRILRPFYLYFLIHFLLFFFFPMYFTHFGLQKNLSYILGSIFLTGGINASWLPLLFLELTLLTPFFFLLHKRRLLWIYVVSAIFVTTVGTLWFFPYFWYRGIMWVAWSLVFLLGLFTQKFDKTKVFLFIGFITSVLFAMLFSLWPILHHSLNFTDNKYPPNWYYASYAIALTCIFFIVSKKIIRFIPSWIYEYISKKSYSLFFIHYIVLDAILSSRIFGNVFLEFVLTVGISLLISLTLDKITNLVKFQKGL